MKPTTAEWVSKAEGDFAMLDRQCALDARRRCRAFRKAAREALSLAP